MKTVIENGQKKVIFTRNDLVRITHYIDEGISYDGKDPAEATKREFIAAIESVVDYLDKTNTETISLLAN